MIKANDLNMNLAYFETSKTWEYGEYKLLSSDIHNFGARNADGSIDLVKAQRILDVQVAKALNIIKRDLDVKRILTIFSWADLANTRFIEGLLQVIEQQLSGMITDGNKEIKQGKNYSGSGVDVSTDISGFLTSGDRLYKATEDQWYAWQLDKYSIEHDEANNTYTLIDNTKGTVKQVVGTIKLTDAQLQTISDDFKKLVINDPVLQVLLKGKDGAPGQDGEGYDWLTDNYADLTEFGNTAPENTVVRYNINPDGSNNSKGIILLAKTTGGIKYFWTANEAKEYIDNHLALKADTDYVNSELAKRDTKIATNLSKIDALSGGVKVYHYGDKAAADTAKATINFNEGDIAWIGTTGDWVGYHFTGGNWVLNGTVSTHTATLDAYTKSESDAKYENKLSSQEDISIGSEIRLYTQTPGFSMLKLGKSAGQPSMQIGTNNHDPHVEYRSNTETTYNTLYFKDIATKDLINVSADVIFNKLTDQQKLEIAKLSFTDPLKAKYDGYEATINGKIATSAADAKYATKTEANAKASTIYVNDELAKRDTKIATNLSKIDALSGGVKVYHYADKAAADTAKATINFNEGDIAWIGTTGDWVGYHFTGGNWVLNGTVSTHTATLDAYTKSEADAKYTTKTELNNKTTELKAYIHDNILKYIAKDASYVAASDPNGVGTISIEAPELENFEENQMAELEIDPKTINPTGVSQLFAFTNVDKGTFLRLAFKNGDVASWDEVQDKIYDHNMLVEKVGQYLFIRSWMLKPKAVVTTGKSRLLETISQEDALTKDWSGYEGKYISIDFYIFDASKPINLGYKYLIESGTQSNIKATHYRKEASSLGMKIIADLFEITGGAISEYGSFTSNLKPYSSTNSFSDASGRQHITKIYIWSGE